MAHNYYRDPGGEDRVYAAEAALLEKRGHRVIRLTAQNLYTGPLSHFIAPCAAIWNGRYYSEVRKLVAGANVSICHFHNTFPRISPAVYYAARAHAVPVVQTLHNYRLLCPAATMVRAGRVCEACLGRSVPWPGVLHGCYRNSRVATAASAAVLVAHRFFRSLLKHVNAFVALTAFARQKYIEGGIPAERIRVKPNFVHPDPGAGTDDRGYFLYVGRLSPEKGIPTLLDAWWRLRGRIPLLIAGGGPLEEKVSEAVRRNPSIQYLGWQPPNDVLALMRGASALLVPSVWYEPFGLTVIEAYAVGLPVLASDIGGLAEIVHHGRTGLRFRPADSDDLAAAVEWSLSHPSEMAQMGAEARQEYERKYTAESNYAALMEIYDYATQSAK